jgi:hypothetical protein
MSSGHSVDKKRIASQQLFRQRHSSQACVLVRTLIAKASGSIHITNPYFLKSTLGCSIPA